VAEPAKKITRITTRAAALILKTEGIDCTEDKITRWCRDGLLKKAKKVGGQWYINEAEVREMLE
jgi:predicted site-specific integrase-resolvase